MPFDGTGFPGKREPPRRSGPSGDAACVLIILAAFILLVMPISLHALADIVRFLSGG